MIEAWDSSGAVVNRCDGLNACKVGMEGGMSETARWQSTQCVQVPESVGLADGTLLPPS